VPLVGCAVRTFFIKMVLCGEIATSSRSKIGIPRDD
jgi:hypothetical protein